MAATVAAAAMGTATTVAENPLDIRDTGLLYELKGVNFDIQCGICHLIVDKALETGCGHLFCHECGVKAGLMAMTMGPCPICQSVPMDRPRLSKLVDRTIFNAKSRCLHKECTWRGEYGYLKSQLS